MSQIHIDLPRFELKDGVKDAFLLLPYGEHRTDDGQRFAFGPEDAGSVVSFFKSLGRDLQIDYEHQSLGDHPAFTHFKAPNGQAPAAAWIAGMEPRADGLWATGVRWTEPAMTALKSGQYRYFSPVLLWRDGQEFGRVRAIHSVALTNTPRLTNLPALAATCDLGELLESLGKEHSMAFKDDVAGAVGKPATTGEAELVTAVKDAVARAAQVEGLTAFKSTAEPKLAQLPTLEQALAEQKAKVTAAETKATKAEQDLTAFKSTAATAETTLRGQLVEAALDFAEGTGRISPAQRAHWKTIVEKDPVAGLTAFKALPVGAVVPVGKLTGAAAAGGAAETSKTASSPDDHLTACRSIFTAEQLKRHDAAIAYQAAHPGTGYVEALSAIDRAAKS